MIRLAAFVVAFALMACSARAAPMAKPEDMTLKGNIRVAELTTAIGRVSLRWPRSVEQLFGRTPERAMADAATSVSRALLASSFPSSLQHINQNWSVVFLDSNQPMPQVPIELLSSCHPGWMTVPANIYVVAQRAANYCDGREVPKSLADQRLAQLLIHEIGHALEYQLLGQQNRGDRMRAEGFASWFEQYGSDYSGIIPRGSARSFYRGLARSALSHPGPFVFQGSAEDYARASLFFSAVESRRGISGIVDIYGLMKRGFPLISAIQRSTGWSDKQLGDELIRVVR